MCPFVIAIWTCDIIVNNFMCLLFRLRRVFPQEGSLSNIEGWKGVDHIILLSQVLISCLARVGITKFVLLLLFDKTAVVCL